MKSIPLLVSIILAFTFQLHAQCDITPVSAKLCRGNSISFSIAANPVSYSTIKWIFGDGDSSVQKTSIINHVYNSAGTFNVSVTLYDAGMNIICGPKFSIIQIFDLPTAKFDLLTDSNQHFSNNFFKFSEKAVSGKSNAPIIFRNWYFGDGDSSFLVNPEHIYSGCGTYTVKLIVKDSNGCMDTLDKQNFIISRGPIPKFELLNPGGCLPPFTAFFKDASCSVSKWEYIQGDGAKTIFHKRPVDSIFAVIYQHSGVFYPYLIGYDSNFHHQLGKWINCASYYPNATDSNQIPIKVTVHVFYKLGFTGDSLIQTGDTARFIDLCESGYDSLFWFWGDGTHYERRGRGNAEHVYNLPSGVYDTTYKVVLDGWGKKVHCVDIPKYRTIRVVRTLGINQSKYNDQILVYPNPFSYQTRIILPDKINKLSEICLYDMNGKTIRMETIVSGNNILLYRNKLLPGMYTLKIITDRVFLVKVIVE